MPKFTKSKIYWGGIFPEYELRRREYGFKQNIGWESNFKYSLYSALSPTTHKDPKKSSCSDYSQHGGIFNFGFSPDGRQLAAACENKCILFYDPITHKQTHLILNAHKGCVNCVRFLDSRLFATCSDDNTVALWDVRKLNRRIRVLKGHENWVKNIEYSSNDGLLVTSGFDGKILGWDINSFCEEGPSYFELFRMKGLMRVRLTPDASKLVICTTSGHMVLIHNLDLLNLLSDWKEFQNQIYGVGPVKSTTSYSRNSKRNRFEFISDFPAGNTAEVIHSLQIHPQGWCVLSRNTSTENTSEWTCVHDIQDIDPDEEDLSEQELPKFVPSPTQLGELLNHNNEELPIPVDSAVSSLAPSRERRRRHTRQSSIGRIEISRVEIMLRHHLGGDGRHSDTSDSSEDPDDDGEPLPQSRNPRETLPERLGGDFEGFENQLPQSHNPRETLPEGLGGDFEGFEGTDGSLQFRVTSLGILEALERIGVLQHQDNWRHRSRSNDSETSEQSTSTDQQVNPRPDFSVRYRRETNRMRTAAQLRNAFFIQERARHRLSPISLFLPHTLMDDKIGETAKSYSRLTNYTEELNKGRGFIKELCFSSDGRLICSPYGRGVRLLMFDNKCSELSHCIQKSPQPLYAVSTNVCHSKCVVSTQFSPTDCLLVSGCLSGKIVWHQPHL